MFQNTPGASYAGEAYYYMFSIMLVAYVFFYFAVMVYFKLTGRTLYGLKFRANSTEYKSISRVFSKRNIIIASLLTPVSIVNLLFQIRYLKQVDDGALLIAVPIFIAVTTIVVFIKIGDQLAPKSRKRPNNKKEWSIV